MNNIQKTLRCTIWRSGTSKGIYLLENDIPPAGPQRDALLLRLFGSPDKRQIDGLGGADPLTSKVAIIGPASVDNADIDYTYGMVSIENPVVLWRGNCGNISAAVAPFAIDNGLIKVQEPVTNVRIHNVNTDTIIIAEVPIVERKPAQYGEYTIDGVPGTGAKISLDYSQTAGGVTGKILPTGNCKDVLQISGLGNIEVSIVDVANPEVFVRAADVGMSGLELPDDMTPSLNKKLEKIRGSVAALLHLASCPEKAYLESANIPHLVIVSPPADYISSNNIQIKKEQISLVCRAMFMQKMHKTYPGTGSVCTAVASCIKGSIVNEVAVLDNIQGIVSIGHPLGIFDVEVSVSIDGKSAVKVERVVIGRTARKLMEGYAYL